MNLCLQKNSYEYFVESFKRNFEKHLESLRRYNGQKDKGVFLIEQTDAMIFVDGTYPVCPYTLYQDKILLKYIYQFKDVLKYVIYTNGEIVDVVQLTLIPQLLLRIPEGIQFKVGRTVSTTLQCFIDLQI